MVTFGRPEAWLLLIPAAILLVVLARSRHPVGSTGRRLAVLLVRFLVLALVVGAAADPTLERVEPRPRRLVLLLDVSDSALEDARSRGLARIREIRTADPSATVEAHAFGESRARLPWPPTAGDLDGLDGLADATDIATALSTGLAAGKDGEFVRIVLVTDGHETIGDAAPAARAVRRAGAKLDVIPLAAPTPRIPPTAPRVRALDAPAVTDADAPLAVRVAVDAAGREEVEVVLRADGREVARATARPDADRAATVTFPPIELPEGSHRLEAAVVGATGPGVARAVRVRTGPRALCVRDGSTPGLIEAALRTSGIAVTVVSLDALRTTLETAAAPDVLVLDQTGTLRPILAALPELLGALRRGVGVVLTDGIDLVRTRATPLLPLLPVVPDPPAPPAPSPRPPDESPDPGPGVRVEITEKEAMRVALLLLVDTSGSMRGEKLAMARLAAVRAAEALDDQDVIAVLGFSDEPYWVVRPTPARARRRIAEGLMGMLAHGGTDVHLALLDGFAALRKIPFGVRHAILLSDGHTPPALFRTMVERAASERITLSAVAIGDGADSRLLNWLATWGRGAFRWAATPAEIPRIVTDDAIRVLDEAREHEDAPSSAADTAPPAEPDPPEPEPPAAEPTPEALRVAAPHPAVAGVAADVIPPLGGIAPTRGRASAWIAIETRGDGRPVLAQWRVGLARILVFTADLEGPAADSWRRWPDLPRVWAQAVRGLSADAGASKAPELEAVLGPETVRVRASGPGGSVRLRVIEGDGSRDLETTTADDGTVEAVLPRQDTARSRLVEAIGPDGGRRAMVVEVPVRIRPEEAAAGTSETRLRRLVDLAGGRYDPRPTDVPASPERRTHESLALWWLGAAALLMPLDVALRRLG